jgi:hypothetical protein
MVLPDSDFYDGLRQSNNPDSNTRYHPEAQKMDLRQHSSSSSRLDLNQTNV